MFEVINKKTLGSKDFRKNFRDIFIYENNGQDNPHKFSYQFVFIPFLSFHRNQKQESNFQ